MRLVCGLETGGRSNGNRYDCWFLGLMRGSGILHGEMDTDWETGFHFVGEAGLVFERE